MNIAFYLKRIALIALLGSLALASGCTKKEEEAKISGRVTWDGKPIAMAWVEVFVKGERDNSTPPVAETASGEDGRFEVAVMPGRYWVWAKATEAGQGRDHRLVGEATPNPVEPAGGGRAIVEIALSDAGGFASSAGPKGAGARGQVLLPEGVELGKRGLISIHVYQEHNTRPVGPGFVAAVEADAEGLFTVNLAPGLYTLAARLRLSGRDYGPPASDDLVAVEAIEVGESGYLEVGELKLSSPDPKVWAEVISSLGSGATSLTGRVLKWRWHPGSGAASVSLC